MSKGSLVGILTILLLAYIGWQNLSRSITVYDGERLISVDGTFSFIPPKGWVNRGAIPDGMFIVNPEVENGIYANILISTHEAGSEESREQITARIMSEYEDITLLDAEVFATDADVTGSVINSMRTNNLGIVVHRSHYILPHSSGVIIIAGTCAESCRDKNGVIFNGVAKSLRHEGAGCE